MSQPLLASQCGLLVGGRSVRVTDATYACVGDEYLILVDRAGAVAITLALVANTRVARVAIIDCSGAAATNNITISRNAAPDTFNGGALLWIIHNDYGMIEFVPDRTDNVWRGGAIATGSIHVGDGTATGIIRTDYALDFNPVDRPSTSVTVALAGVAGALPIGTLYYRVTYITALGETDVQPRIGAPNVTTVAGNQQVNISNIPVSTDPRVTGRRIYRSTIAGGLYTAFLVTTLNTTDTTYTDNIAEGALGASRFYCDNTTCKGISVDGTAIMVASGLNTVFGFGAYPALFSGTTTGGYNTIYGYQCGLALTSGVNDTILGYQAGIRITTGTENTITGCVAGGYIVGGVNNTIYGYSSMGQHEGSYCTIMGSYSASASAGSIVGNDYYGCFSGHNTTTGSYNAGFGFHSLHGVTTGSLNVGVGYGAGYTASTGHANTYLGYAAGWGVTTGSGNVVVGQCCDVPSATGNGQGNLGCVIFWDGGYYDTSSPYTQKSTPNAGGMVGVMTQNYRQPLNVGGPIRIDMATTNVSNPPTDAELDAAFGAPAAADAATIRILDDNAGDANVWIIVNNGTSWWYAAMTKAV